MDEKLKLKVIQLLQAASQGDQKATQTIQNIMDKAKQGDLEAIQLALAIQTVMLEMLGQSQKAAHGAKLQYLKSLKHQCADDEELVYYKKGGSVKCGCEKKFLEGGTTPRKDTGVTKFRLDLKKKKENNTWTSQDDEHLLNARRKNGKNLTPEEKSAILKWNNLSLEQKSKHQLEEGKNGMKVEKDCGGSAIAKFKAKCGSKLKKHLLGGSLNGIPFMQTGTPKGGIEYNPTEVYNPMVHGVIGPTSYDPMIHGVLGPKETPQLKVEQYRVALYKRKYPKAIEQTNGLKVMLRGRELLGNITALTRVPTNAIKNWWNSTPNKNLNQIAYTNRNTNSWDLGQRYLGLKKGGIL